MCDWDIVVIGEKIIMDTNNTRSSKIKELVASLEYNLEDLHAQISKSNMYNFLIGEGFEPDKAINLSIAFYWSTNKLYGAV